MARKNQATAKVTEAVTEVKAPTSNKAPKEKVEVVLTEAQKKEMEGLKTISSKIRYLHNEGLTRGQIATALNKRYQHVRNVLESPLKKSA